MTNILLINEKPGSESLLNAEVMPGDLETSGGCNALYAVGVSSVAVSIVSWTANACSNEYERHRRHDNKYLHNLTNRSIQGEYVRKCERRTSSLTSGEAVYSIVSRISFFALIPFQTQHVVVSL